MTEKYENRTWIKVLSEIRLFGCLAVLFKKMQKCRFKNLGTVIHPLAHPFSFFPQWDNHFLHSDDKNITFSGKMDFFLQEVRTELSLLGHAGHRLLGCVLQVDGRSNGESTVIENVLGLVDIGSFQPDH